LFLENLQIVDLLNPNNQPISCYQNNSVQVCENFTTTIGSTRLTTHTSSTTQPPKGNIFLKIKMNPKNVFIIFYK
jgi:hypothetical protein